jgi:hypothetical protein
MVWLRFKETAASGVDWVGSCMPCGRLPVSAARQRRGNRPVLGQARTTNAGGLAALLNSTPLSVAAGTVAAFYDESTTLRGFAASGAPA